MEFWPGHEAEMEGKWQCDMFLANWGHHTQPSVPGVHLGRAPRQASDGTECCSKSLGAVS